MDEWQGPSATIIVFDYPGSSAGVKFSVMHVFHSLLSGLHVHPIAHIWDNTVFWMRTDMRHRLLSMKKKSSKMY